MEKNNEYKENKGKYEDTSGTGVLGAIIFFILIMLGMYFLSKII